MKIYIGTAGIPGSCKECNSIDGVKAVSRLKLNAMEVEFVRGVKMGLDMAEKVGEAAKKYNVKLSIHAPYYINLCSEDKAKVQASKKRIIDSCERGAKMGADVVVFHPAYYGKLTPEQAYDIVKQEILDMQKTIKKRKWKVKLAPETTGKVNVFGSVDEILKLVKDTKCSFCIDFAHIYSRNIGHIDYPKLLDKFKKFKHLHCHFSGIEYSKKGERRHIPINSHPPYKPLAKEILKRKLNITLISESPILEIDALKMKKYLNQN